MQRPSEGQGRPPLWMRSGEDLHWRLTKARDLRAEGLSFVRIGDRGQVDGSLICEVEEQIGRLGCSGTLEK